MNDERDKAAEAIERLLDEAGGVDVPHGEHYDDLLALILEELSIQLLMVEVAVPPEAVAQIAQSIALEVDLAFTQAPRNFQPFH